jgi:hypothetical protein
MFAPIRPTPTNPIFSISFAGCGIGVGGGIRAIRVALAHDCAAEQTGHSRRNQDFSGGVPHKNDDFDPEHLWHIAGGMLKRK